ncbi:hypothetical protein B0H14DRAFT_2568308 [Mycena olivaceomarginata]|nr:hypothetical protein B0H14DRAFT_2568308 [Mycena olivaceomarginata]
MARVLEYIKIQCSAILPHQAAPYNTLIKLPARLGGTSSCTFKLNISPNPTFIKSFALGFADIIGALPGDCARDGWDAGHRNLEQPASKRNAPRFRLLQPEAMVPRWTDATPANVLSR